MKSGIIYKITNNIINKIYVGRTIRTAKEYWNYHKVRAKGGYVDKYLYRSMRKYGIDNFHFEVVEEVHEVSNKALNIRLNELERYYIKELNSKVPNGYNITDGGEGTLGYKITDKHRANLSKACLGRASPRKGVKLSKETRKKLSKAAKARFERENNPFLGRKHSEETIKLIRKINTEYQNRPDIKLNNKLKQPHRIPVDMCSIEGELIQSFISLKDARRWLRENTSYAGDIGVIKKAILENKIAYNHLWKSNKDK